MARELKEVVSHDDELIKELVGLWEQSVKASHSFLNYEQIAQIKAYVPTAIKEVETLVVACEECGLEALWALMARN